MAVKSIEYSVMGIEFLLLNTHYLLLIICFKWLLMGNPWYKANIRYFVMQGTW